MKHFWISLILLLVLMGCKQETETSEYTPLEETDITMPYSDHNARLSLDFDGTYQGTLPCADCEGIKTTITIDRDNNFERVMVYLGKDENGTFREEGMFSWDETGNVITLLNAEEPNQYHVGENVLFHLDMEGNRITGDLSEHYKLHKK